MMSTNAAATRRITRSIARSLVAQTARNQQQDGGGGDAEYKSILDDIIPNQLV